LVNRREFERRLQLEAQAAAETGRPLSLVFLDVDHFKDFNDRHGHRIGDEVLKLVAGKLRNRVREKDLPARYGGEEFVALLPDTPLEDAAIVAERIRSALASSIVRHRSTGETYGTVTASFGIATYCPGEALEHFVHRADEALYRAKRDGRNRTEVADLDVAVESVEVDEAFVEDIGQSDAQGAGRSVRLA
ncbi:MAG: GGDEF domain-containing protein, partial [Alphaproteobacteria bacterium]